jgi:Cu-Zn family superoxide dismutase
MRLHILASVCLFAAPAFSADDAAKPAARPAAAAPVASAPVTRAVAVLQPLKDSKVQGTITFTQEKDGVHVLAKLSGLEPGMHGFHVHELGDCSAPDGTSAGGHYNPKGEPHGAPTDAHRHTGDLGNVEASAEGTATLDWVDPNVALSGERSVLGRGVIVHAKKDDLKTQPTGDAGARVACGVIGAAKPAQ